MAYERYTTKSGRLMIALRTFHSTVQSQSTPGEFLSSPTTVELLDVQAEKVNEMSYGAFEVALAEGKLKRVSG